ncbi:Serine/arginine-rich SC35-like splicing factor SCL30 [Bienertia sinuspersici]
MLRPYHEEVQPWLLQPPRRGYGSRGRSPPRGYSPPRRGYSPPRRGYSPPRRGGGGGGGYGRRKEPNHGSLLVRNIPLDCRPEELRVPFERFGLVRDVYIPKDYYTGEPRGFAFVQFVDSYDASEAQYHMNGQIFAGREISVVVAAESRKRPEDMRRKTRQRSGGPRYGGRRSPGYRRSRSRSVSRSRSPNIRSSSKGGHRSRSYSPSPKRRDEYSASPSRRPADHPRSPRDSPRGEDVRRSYSPDQEDRNEES